jgi:hypothetical protein
MKCFKTKTTLRQNTIDNEEVAMLNSCDLMIILIDFEDENKLKNSLSELI